MNASVATSLPVMSWQPPEDVTDFAGDPLPKNLDFFAPPPPEIGKVQCAFSTLRQGEHPMHPGMRFYWTATTAILCGGLGLGIVWYFEIKTPGWILAWILIPGLIGAWCARVITEFTHTCAYVGLKGMARFRCMDQRDNLTTKEVLIFQPGLECEASLTRHYEETYVLILPISTSYKYTSYCFEWKDRNGITIYTIKGVYKSEENRPPMDTEFWYARAGYVIWEFRRKLEAAATKLLGSLASENSSDSQ